MPNLYNDLVNIHHQFKLTKGNYVELDVEPVSISCVCPLTALALDKKLVDQSMIEDIWRLYGPATRQYFFGKLLGDALTTYYPDITQKDLQEFMMAWDDYVKDDSYDAIPEAVRIATNMEDGTYVE